MKAISNVMAAAAVVAAALASPLAAAHATLKSSDPQAGATVAAAPKQVALTFNEKIEEAFSSITLTDAAGNVAATGKAKVDTANPAIVRVDAPALQSGTYTVKWAVAGHDGHRRTGNFTFTVK
ncbi:copper homeostasis periplasmic binding protein CopC [Massilia sp. YMA4]|uniref:Copper homeostasis periplasmic binding protein CopC n=1 Tax=[Empedobacter] haloabium TaxID=592317 RepID=A0ABZ1URL9_9BURK|nr:copper homeostasis periplasmic binding protein CopC [Massilia sp. YMA4]AXA91362.1 copper resistance protein CopC [Massilia sp. YMA4]